MGFLNKAKSKIQSWHSKEFIPKKIRDVISYGNILTITMAEHCAYKIVSQDVRVGALPGYTLYLLIPLIAAVEALLAPWVSWLGYRARRKTLLLWSLAILVIPFVWLFIPSPLNLEQTEFCSSTTQNKDIVYTGLSMRASLRLVVALGTAICFCLTRVATWSHYVAYTDDNAPERTCVHVGVIILTRVLGLLFHEVLSETVDINIIYTISLIYFFTTINTLRLYFDMPRSVKGSAVVNAISLDRGYFKSLRRVLCDLVAMSQMTALALLAAALWGFGYHEQEIVKTNYNILRESHSIIDHYTKFFRYFLAIVAVAYMGVKQSGPIRQQYDITKGLQISFKMSLLAVILYIAIVTVPPCKKGEVAGLDTPHQYANPLCSLSCGCVPRWREYSPVCVTDTMTTFLSPCEAGCTGWETLNSLPVYTNCSCAASGLATPGACSDYSCQRGYNFHLALFGILLTASVVAFQAQSMVILRSVDPRDKSIAMGVTWSVVAAVVYVCGNNIFYSIALKHCNWYTGERCQLHSAWYPYIVGGVCALLAFMSLIINVAARRYLRGRSRELAAEEDSSA